MRLLRFPWDAALLRRRALPLPESAFATDMLRAFGKEMGEMVVSLQAAGLAATQLDLDPAWRIIALGLGNDAYSILCNPEIVSSRGESWSVEACLSFASVPEQMPAPGALVVRWRSVEGKVQETECQPNAARAVAHEIDHLNGKLIIDRMGELQRRIFLRKVEKRRRSGRSESGEAS